MKGRSPGEPDEDALTGGEDPYSAFRDPTIVILVGIVCGTLVAMVIGLGGPGAVAGNESGPVFPFPDLDDGDSATAVELRIHANRSTIRPGDAVTFTVERAGDDPVANASLRVGGERYRTGDDGTVTVRFDRGGEYTVRATASADGINFIDARRTVTVERYVTDLNIRANASRATAGDAVRFTVTDGTDPVEGTVEVAGKGHTTGADGTVVVIFERAGEFTATAIKGRTPTTRFNRSSVDVSVTRRRASLSLTVEDDPVAHEPVRVRVTRDDTGGPANATVTVDGKTYETDDDGIVNVTVEAAGEVAFTASAPDTPAVTFDDAALTVAVDRRTVSLALAANRTRVEKGAVIRFDLTREDTGEPVDGSLSVGNATHAIGADGTVNVTFDDPGTVPVRGLRTDTATETFEADGYTVSVRGADFTLSSLDAPDEVARGENVTVEATVTNAGNEPGGQWVKYRFDDAVADREYVRLNAGESRTVDLTTRVAENASTGEYSHGVESDDADIEATITVAEREDAFETIAARALVLTVNSIY
ncbi:CARDB domain-containing protein [Halostella sp. PRR32]|uniref:CARDB domain-containing protein n=1 Tax=Halostella sp. PRR32 TaxID=3098147 RepID=UPI002B1DF950|nr:CARDB domain-containing protein [Halostella sp. PRR32]